MHINFANSDTANDIMPNVAAIERCMARGMKACDAMDYVLGEGSYLKFAKKVYESCRAKGN